MSDLARTRWFVLVAVRLVAAIGAVFGLVLLARADAWGDKAIGVGIVLAAFYVMAVVPRALAHRWRSR